MQGLVIMYLCYALWIFWGWTEVKLKHKMMVYYWYPLIKFLIKKQTKPKIAISKLALPALPSRTDVSDVVGDAIIAYAQFSKSMWSSQNEVAIYHDLRILWIACVENERHCATHTVGCMCQVEPTGCPCRAQMLHNYVLICLCGQWRKV